MSVMNTRCLTLILASMTASAVVGAAQDAPTQPQGSAVGPLQYDIQVDTAITHYDKEFLWFHPRVAPIPAAEGTQPPTVIMTLQKHLHVSDYYSALQYMLTEDMGKTWTEPVAPPELAWEERPNGEIIGVCDVTPGWHAATGKVLAIGAQVRYLNGQQLYDEPQSRAGSYAVYDPKSGGWTPWRRIEMPDPAGKFYGVTPGCVQWIVEPDGPILLPIYFNGDSPAMPAQVTVLRCAFDGTTLTYVEHGDEMRLDVERGLCEPSLAKYQNRFYLTIRNDQKGYVTVSDDGLHYAPIRAWTFDDGQDLGSYNTQQHWLTHSEGLFLVYTRRGADNDHIMRHRAPLFMAQVDPARLCVIRASEKVLIPERGATLGNFGATTISPSESWVTVSEGIWNEDALARGAKGATFVARITWATPNLLASQ